MTLLSSRQAQAFLALSCVGSVLTPTLAQAQTGADTQQPALGGVTVTDTAIDDTRETRVETPKATRPVRDTPQTITVLTGQQLEQQNLLTLRDALSIVPGITFGAGEGGGGYGDSINMRGYSANTDITQDGVRDSGQYSRTDPFNTEQIEVTNGANSVIAGSGSVGGSINIVTKRPLAEDRVVMTAGIGTDAYYRGTIDANLVVGDFAAFRLNAMGHRNDVPGRDVENYERWGIAPSFTIGINSPTRLTLQYLHQEDTNIPQYGVPYVAALGGLLPGADISDYFGYRKVDTQESTIDQLTAIFEHEFSDTVSIRNLTRWQNVEQFVRVSPPQGTYCLASGTQANGAACPATTPPGYFLPGGPRGTTRDSRNELAFTQLDLMATAFTGGIEHTITLGGALSWEKYGLVSGNWKRNADGTTPAEPLINIANPNEVVMGPDGFSYGSNRWTGPVNFLPTATQDGEQKNYAVYLFDTMKLTEQFELNAGIRYEKNKGWFRPGTIAGATATSPGVTTPGTKVWNEDDLFSYRVGLVYKPVEAISAYVAYGNSKTPSKTSVNGSCTIAGVNGATATSCNVDPETAVNYEVGVKAELGEGVLLSAALFRNERSNYKVASIDPTIPDQQLDGKSRVNGVALGANGQITRAWSITANYTYLDSKVLQNAANGAADDPQKGAPLTNTPKHSGSVFTTYKLPFGLQVGYGFTYQGKFYLNNTGDVLHEVDDYLIHNAYLSYNFTDTIGLQLNVKNFTDEKYFTGVRNNATTNAGWARVGEGISAIGTLTVGF
ncbi:iron complex outermembrane receptor protein [Sphingobium sp. SYK-6]|uniref:TonB-dependent receptor n=1 Tax=Sphingobium sp. (strain NBRC 103272 / SYK-6) TaxID=627192 RepID=UPI0002277A77|nr:TonB-dependent siderophore receptor [Sphingobium sp. SYK-6]BAK68130.1 iron complex outermembrane receptor protein [Sphingobium sp. SYK-6]